MIEHKTHVARMNPSEAFVTRGPTWQAMCRCGWIGPVRITQEAANADALAHKEN